MNILQEINQKSFKTNTEKAMVNLLFTYNWHRDYYKDVYKAYGIKSQHYNVLRILRGKNPDPCSPGEIKQVMLDKSPDLTRLLDKLVDMDLVQRNLCQENRRMMDVYITSEGEKTLNEIEIKYKSVNNKRKSKFTEEDAARLSDLLDKFRE